MQEQCSYQESQDSNDSVNNRAFVYPKWLLHFADVGERKRVLKTKLFRNIYT